MSNRNSRIVSNVNVHTLHARETYTDRRDPGSLVAVAQTSTNNATNFLLSRGGVTVELNGHEARTLLRLLETHYYG